MIQKKCKSSCGSIEADTKTKIGTLENGQTTFHVVAISDDGKHEHSVTVGAEDGKDALVNLSDDELKTALQNHLDLVRQAAVDVLAARSKVKKFAEELV